MGVRLVLRRHGRLPEGHFWSFWDLWGTSKNCANSQQSAPPKFFSSKPLAPLKRCLPATQISQFIYLCAFAPKRIANFVWVSAQDFSNLVSSLSALRHVQGYKAGAKARTIKKCKIMVLPTKTACFSPHSFWF